MMEPEKIERTFPVSGPARLQVGNIRGSVVVRAVEGLTEIKVTAIKYPNTGNDTDTEIELTQEAGGKVVAKTHFREQGWLFFIFAWGQPCKVDYIVETPVECSLELSCVSSTGLVDGLKGDFDLRTVSGDLDLRQLSGLVRVSSTSGRLDAQGVSGTLKVTAVSGDAELRGADFAAVDASTVSGAIRLETPLREGPYRFHSVSGELRLLVPQGTGCELEHSRISGRLRTNLPVQSRSARREREVVRLGNGGPQVRFSTTSGNMEVWASQAPAPAAPPLLSSAELRRKVLERIDQGEITAEEGLQELK